MKKKLLFILIIITIIPIFSIELKLIKILQTGSAPKSIYFTPNSEYAWVNNLEDCSVWKYSIEEMKLIKKIQFKKTPAKGYNYKTKDTIESFAEKPVECTFTNNGNSIWISLHNGNDIVLYNENEKRFYENDKRKALLIDLINNTKTNISFLSFNVGKTPKIVKSSPNGKYIFVSNWFSDNVSIIDAIDKKFIKNINVIHIPRGIAFDNEYAYIANMGASYISKISLDSLKLKKNIYIGLNPRSIQISSDNKYLYATLNIPGQFVKLDLKSEKIIKTIDIGKKPRSFVLSKDNKYAFVLLYEEDQLAIVNTQTMEIISKIKTGLKPIGIDITNNSKYIWITNYYENTIYIYKIQY